MLRKPALCQLVLWQNALLLMNSALVIGICESLGTIMLAIVTVS
jgi:hypothetical protein